MKINDKGFTLVEIIITIGIIGVVAVIAFPAILALQSSNEDTKYEAYTDLLGSNARIYVNSFEKDIFPEDDVDNSCFVLDYETMYNNDLIKDIDVPGVYCNNKSLQDVKTFVKITPDESGYDYETSIYCYDGSGNMVYESEKKVDTTDCDAIDEDGPSIEIISDTDVSNISNIKYSDYRKDHNYTIKVSDKSGLVDNIEIRYGWGYDGNIPTTYITHSFNNNYGVNEVSFSSNTNDEALINDKNGKWKLYVEVVNVADTEGYSTTDGVSTSFGLDNTAPVTPVINNTNHNKWVNFDYSVTANSSDAGSGIAYYQYSYDGSKWTTYKNSAMNSFTTTKFTKERNQNVYIRACDRLGHCSLNGSSNIKIDKTAPSMPGVSAKTSDGVNYTGSWTNKNVTVTLKSTDSLSGIKEYGYSKAYTGGDSGTDVDGIISYSKEGSYSYHYRAIDQAGNVSAWTWPSTPGSDWLFINIDKSAPTTPSITNANHDKWVNFSYSVVAKSSDSGSGIAYYQYSYDNSSWITYSNSATTSFTTTQFSVERDQNVYIRACDYAGYCSGSGTTRIKIDKTPPRTFFTISTGTHNPNATGGMSFHIANHDDQGTVNSGAGDTIIHTFYPGITKVETAYNNSGYNIFLPTNDSHTYRVHVQVFDKAGNKQVHENTNVDGWYFGDFKIVNPTPPAPTYPPNTCKIRGDQIRRAPITWTCSDGVRHTQNYYYQRYCTDSAGNIYAATSNKWVCSVAPYGPNEGWIVIDD